LTFKREQKNPQITKITTPLCSMLSKQIIKEKPSRHPFPGKKYQKNETVVRKSDLNQASLLFV
jgi:hypothetical protein